MDTGAPNSSHDGCGRDGDGVPYRSIAEFELAPVLELGLGYAAARVVRLEVVAEYRPRAVPIRRPRQFPGDRTPAIGCRGPVVAVGHAGGLRRRDRAGRAEARLSTTLCRGRRQQDRRNAHDLSEEDDNRAWRVPDRCRLDADGGFEVPLNGRMSLDVAWRYTDLEEIRTGRGAGSVVWRDGSREPFGLDLAATRRSCPPSPTLH